MIKTHEVGAELTRKKINNEEDQAWEKDLYNREEDEEHLPLGPLASGIKERLPTIN